MLRSTHTLALALLAASLLLGSCQNTGQKPVGTPAQPLPVATVEPQSDGLEVDLSSGRLLVGGRLLNAKSGERIQDEVLVVVAGPDSAQLEKTEYRTQNGLVSLQLKPGVQPSFDRPLNLIVVAHAKGYFAGSTPVYLGDSLESFTLKLVNMADAPDGVAVTSDSSAVVENGALSAALKLQLMENSTQSLAGFGLEPGTVLTDRQGVPLSGALETHVGYFSNATPESLGAFPGGFMPTVSRDNQDTDGYFVTGGFVSVEITDSSGRQASDFSRPADLSIQIPAGTKNPDTGQAVKAGDNIGIWSHDTQTGQWKEEGKGLVSGADAQGNFTVNYQAEHLSYWNLDWFSSEVCNPKLKLNWDSDNQVPVMMKLEIEGDSWASHNSQMADPVNTLNNVPINRTLDFVASYDEQEVGRKTAVLDQNCSDITVDISTAGLPQMMRVPIYVSLSSQTEFTRDQLAELVQRLGLNAEQQLELLNYTHPGDPNALYSFTDQGIKELDKMGFPQVKTLRDMLRQKYRPSFFMDFKPVTDHPYTWDWLHLQRGRGTISVFENQKYEFWANIYLGDEVYTLNRQVQITPDMDRVTIDIKDARLTLEAMLKFVEQQGITLP